MKPGKKIYLGAIILAALAITVAALAGRGKEVETVQARQGSITRTVVDTGYVQSTTDIDLYATQNVRVAEAPVKTGQPVKKDQILVVLENLDLALQVSEARSQLAQVKTTVAAAEAAIERARLELKDAEDNLNRIRELFQSGAASQVEYEKAKLQVEAGQQGLSEQNSQLENFQAQVDGLNQTIQQLGAKEEQLVVKSPANGVVVDIPVKPGQVLTAGALLVSIAAPDQLEVKADILSDDLAEIKVGQKVTITAPVLGEKTLAGEVKQIYPRAEEKQSALGIMQRRVPVIIALQEPGSLKVGYEVKVAIETICRQNVLILPREAVRTTGNNQKKVMAVSGKKVCHIIVQTGISDQENIEITGGLSAGDEVVKDGSLDLKEKSRVKPVNKSMEKNNLSGA